MIRIYGLDSELAPRREAMSRVIHSCMVDVLGMPRGKRAHRFIRLQSEDFFMPEGRSQRYTVLEMALIAGREAATKKRLIKLLFERFEGELGIAPMDLEVTIFEAPAEHWGFRGMTGDEAVPKLDYEVGV